jgi:cytoskeletal protein CcmA (bactofilin family)
MKHRLAIIILILGAMLLTSCATMSFEGDLVVKSGDTLRGNIFATSGSVTMQENSRVTGSVILTSGELHLGKNAQVGGNVVLTSGALYLEEGAVVHGDVILSGQDIIVHQAAGSTIEGKVSYDIASFVISNVIKGFLLFCVLPFAIIIALILVLGMWLGRSSRRAPQVVPAPASSETEDAQEKLKQLKAMLDGGLITETDYETKKADILSKM